MSDGLKESRERDISFTGEPSSGFSPDSVLENQARGVKPLSRRTFLKLGALALGAAALSTSPLAVQAMDSVNTPFPMHEGGGKLDKEIEPNSFRSEIKYNESTEKIIKEVREKYGVKITTPEFLPESYAGVPDMKNIPWKEEEIKIIAETLEKLPPQFFNNNRSPKHIVLYRQPGMDTSNSGGFVYSGYGDRAISFYVNEGFDVENRAPGYSGKIYGKMGNIFSNLIFHEYIHSYAEAYPALLQDWIKYNDWYPSGFGPDGKATWSNKHMEYVFPTSNADKDPNEDLAVSFGFLVSNPSLVAEPRLKFFKDSSFFQNWEYLETAK